MAERTALRSSQALVIAGHPSPACEGVLPHRDLRSMRIPG
jgi:hypothetical protein